MCGAPPLDYLWVGLLLREAIIFGVRRKSRQSVRGPLDVSRFESDHPGKLNSTAVMLRVWQYLAAAAYPSPQSSNAKSLCGAFSADSPKIEAPRGRTSLMTDSKVRVLPAWHVRLELGNVEFSGGKFCRGSGIATGWLAAQTRMVSVVGFAP